MLRSQTTSIAGWACSHCYAWYILNFAYVHVMIYCNDHHLISERKVLLNLEVNLNLPCKHAVCNAVQSMDQDLFVLMILYKQPTYVFMDELAAAHHEILLLVTYLL